MTLSSLANKYSELQQSVQQECVRNLTDAEDYLCKNLQMMAKMDNIFGCEGTNGDAEDKMDGEIVRTKDGNTILSCPSLCCKVKTVKLKRHLQLKHGKKPNSTIDYAMYSARTMEKNKNNSAKVPNVPKVEAVSRNKITNLVSRRQSQKMPSVLETLQEYGRTRSLSTSNP